MKHLPVSIAAILALLGASTALAAAPTVNYHRLDTVYTTGVAIRPDTPLVVGTVVLFEVAPALPAGLILNSATGILSGTPTAAAASADYRVKASSFTDSAIITLRIGVATLAPPSNLQYPLDSVQYLNVPLKLKPTVTGLVTSFSVQPKLPNGLGLDTKTGVISGTPEVEESGGQYVVTAQNVSGATRDTLLLNIRKSAWFTIVRNEGMTETIVGASVSDVCFADAQRGGFVGGAGGNSPYEGTGAVATTNGGVNWGGGSTSGYYMSRCDFAPDGSVGFAIGTTGFNLDGVHTPVVWKMVPGTSNWSSTTFKASLTAVQVPTATTGYILAGNVLFKTLTAGARWDSLSTVPFGGLMSFPSADIGYGWAGGGILQKTVNGGLTWNSLPTGLSGNFQDMEFISNDTGFMVGENGMFARTYNGGVTWQSLPTGTLASLRAVAFENGKIGYAGGQSILLRTTNGGQTWKPQETGFTAQQITGLSAVPGGAYASGNHTGYYPGGFVLKYLASEQPGPDLCEGRLPNDGVATILSTPLNKSTGTSTMVTLAWGGSECADGYRVQLATDSVFSALLIDSILTGTTFNRSGLSPATRYYWRAQARNILGVNSWSQVFSFTTQVAKPAAPLLMAPAHDILDTMASPTLTWGAVEYAVAYRVQVAKDSGFITLIVNDSTVTSLSRVVGPLTTGLHYWRVNARNVAGTGPYSLTRRFGTVLATSIATTRAGLETGARGSSLLRFTLAKRTAVRVRLYDSKGTLLAEPLNETRNAGAYSLDLSHADFEGVYALLEFRAGKHRQTIRLAP